MRQPLTNTTTPDAATHAEAEATLTTVQAVAAAIESLLFIAGRPLEIAELRKLLEIEEDAVRDGVVWLETQCVEDRRGIRVQQIEDQVQFVSAPEHGRFVAALLGMPTRVKLTS